MDVQRGHCWRCEKVLPQLTVPCSRCNVAVYCSTPCLDNDTARHSSVECRMFGPRRCGNCGKTPPNMKECASCSNEWYCSKECQLTDWKSHKPSCKEAKDSMKTLAEKLYQQRSATDKTSKDFPYYIGNIFAEDFLQLEGNELTSGVKEDSLARDYHILSVGCGNLRNTVLTAASLPDEYQGKLHITLNDYDPFVMARNVLFLFMFVRFADTDYIASSLTTIWYSLHISKRDYDLIKTTLEELIQMSAQQLHDVTKGLVTVLDEDLSSLCGIWGKWRSLECQRHKSTSINLRQQRMEQFQKANMAQNLSSYFKELSGTEKKKVQEWFDHALFFSTERKEKNMPFDNPTLTGREPLHTFKAPEESKFVYSVNADAFPYQEWDCLRVREHTPGSHSSPMVMYHKYVTNLLQKVKSLILQGRLLIQVSLANCLDFPNHHQTMNMSNYDRIFTSNIADYVGIPRLLHTFKPLLNPTNSFSVIVTEYMNWLRYIPKADTKLAFMLQQMSLKFLECGAAFSEDTQKNYPIGPSNLREYDDNTSYFLQYLRADIMAGGRGIPALQAVPTFMSVKKYHGMEMRNFRTGLNKLVPFMYRKNARDLTMLNGSDRAVEWCLPKSDA
ncbi:uncharacterized protein LOC119722173 [Patiria miniata]|uniref:MYND-type domain-containing protein n=1 Tax=Patiria miniata TaxID=46514 RepID=A0A913Z8S5_PATMI|nr:uncharacterized protein LOC119722098 [Patiria miniata]XP_038048049.1 uncharacterized protein LOC119722098 [Patiria miniata]XP_038048147.1 uncharacterized protein LOC119722173 [Patiria miniata]XP_038048148.1 uncharacterized protein LOC119722173 [Patiria miniata]